MTVASSCVRPAVRAGAKAASTVPENIAGVSRIHARRAIAGAATPAAPSSPAPRHRRVAIGLTGRAGHAGERPLTATALNSADVLATGMRDQSRLIVRADSSITARC
jgi:hypothetical protein